MDKPPKKYVWKKTYTLVLLANIVYVLLFYVFMLYYG